MSKYKDDIDADWDDQDDGLPRIRRARIAVVGRPNVGKSTLFNRIAGKRLAIVNDTPGVTRDRREAPAKLGGYEIVLVDYGRV